MLGARGRLEPLVPSALATSREGGIPGPGPGLIPGAYGEAPGADSALTHDWHDAWKSVEKLVTVERIAL